MMSVRHAESVPSRVQWIDAARGIGIILVVLGHVERGLVSSGIAQSQWWRELDFVLYTFHMPLFFLLAGLNVPRSLGRGARHFLNAKLWTIAFPYFLWSILQGAILVGLSSLTNGKAGIRDLLSIGWRPMSQFWFLYVLMLCQLTILVVRIRPRLIACLAVAAFAASQFLPQNGVPERYMHALPFFAAGILLSSWATKWTQAKFFPKAFPWFTVFGVLFAVSVYGAAAASKGDFDSVWALPAAGFGIAATIAVSRLLKGWLLAVFAYLGTVSMTIYVMHVLAAAGLRIFLVKAGVPPIDWLYEVLCTAFGVAAPVAAHIVLARMGLLPAFGLAVPRRRSHAIPEPVMDPVTSGGTARPRRSLP
jgi:fucose 4-O-acetylase-like acetyltransferase